MVKSNYEQRFQKFADKIGLILEQLDPSEGISTHDFHAKEPFASSEIEQMFIEVTSTDCFLPKEAKRTHCKITQTRSIFHKSTEEALEKAMAHSKGIPFTYSGDKTATTLILYSSRIPLGFDISFKDSVRVFPIEKIDLEWFNKVYRALENNFDKSDFDFIILFDDYTFAEEVIYAIYYKEKYANSNFLNVLIDKLRPFFISNNKRLVD